MEFTGLSVVKHDKCDGKPDKNGMCQKCGIGIIDREPLNDVSIAKLKETD